MMISAIVPVYNAEATIAAALDSLFAAELPSLEVIVIDDASTDGTAEICQRYPVTLLRQPENTGPACCRNRGVAAAQGDVLLFLDADVVFDADLLPRMAASLAAAPEMAGVLTLTAPEPLNPSFAGRFVALQDYLRYTAICDAGWRSWSYITTRCGMLRREVFEATGGFNEALRLAAYEDLEFSARLDARYQLVLDPTFLVHHHFPATMAKLLRRLHVNARGVMSFSRPMRQKVIGPFLRDRNARAWLALSWVFAAGGIAAWPLWGVAGLCHLGALYHAWWLPRGFYRHEGLRFAALGWLVYNLTLAPFVTGAACGVIDRLRGGSGAGATGE